MKTACMIVSGFVLVTGAPANAQATAFRGTHVGFTTTSGQPGQQLDLRTGYGTSGAPESEQWAYRFAGSGAGARELQTRTARYASDPDAPFAQVSFLLQDPAPRNWRPEENGGGVSPVSGWYAQSSLTTNPASRRQTFNPTGGDAFVAAGTLTGGSFAYEIVSVTPLGGSPGAGFAIGLLVNPAGNTDDSLRTLQGTYAVGADTFDVLGVFDPALAGGGALSDRSVFLGNGNHFHGWGFFVSQRGEYEVGVRVYDTTGTYAASDVFTFRVNSVPTPGAMALLGMGGLVAARRRRVA